MWLSIKSPSEREFRGNICVQGNLNTTHGWILTWTAIIKALNIPSHHPKIIKDESSIIKIINNNMPKQWKVSAEEDFAYSNCKQ